MSEQDSLGTMDSGADDRMTYFFQHIDDAGKNTGWVYIPETGFIHSYSAISARPDFLNPRIFTILPVSRDPVVLRYPSGQAVPEEAIPERHKEGIKKELERMGLTSIPACHLDSGRALSLENDELRSSLSRDAFAVMDRPFMQPSNSNGSGPSSTRNATSTSGADSRSLFPFEMLRKLRAALKLPPMTCTGTSDKPVTIPMREMTRVVKDPSAAATAKPDRPGQVRQDVKPSGTKDNNNE